MSRRTEVERRAAEAQTTTDQRGISNKEDAVKNTAEQRSLGIFAYNIRCRWEIQANKAELRQGRATMRFYVEFKGN